jgi:E3 Ubiquitin ligase
MSDHDRLKIALLMLGLAAAAAWSFRYAFKAWSKNRILVDTPTSRVRSAAQGYVELSGRGVLPDSALTKGPLTGMPCVWWHYRIEERRSRGNSRTAWSTLEQATSETPFFLDDGTGQCLVDPRGAEVFARATNVWYGPSAWPEGCMPNGSGFFGKLFDALLGGKYKYTEQRLQLRDHLQAVGMFGTSRGAQALDVENQIGNLLHEWKQDQAALLARFDSDHDGALSAKEWENARQAARQHIMDGLAEAPAPALNTLADPGDGRAFLLSALEDDSLTQRFRLQTLTGMGVFAGSSAALGWILSRVW